MLQEDGGQEYKRSRRKYRQKNVWVERWAVALGRLPMRIRAVVVDSIQLLQRLQLLQLSPELNCECRLGYSS
jgi:hypothetical protein